MAAPVDFAPVAAGRAVSSPVLGGAEVGIGRTARAGVGAAPAGIAASFVVEAAWRPAPGPVFNPVWHKRPETAHRVRTRISAILKWAVAQGLRSDDPTEAVKAALPRNGHGEKRHHAAVHHRDVADVLRRDGHRAWWGTRLAIIFATLTATRSGEARQARWSEIDLEAKVWTVPGSRSKVGKDHRVPLSRQAVAVLTEARELAGDGHGEVIFPAARVPKPVAGGVLMALLRDLDTNTTLHGMARASFRSWCADSGVDREVAEMCLAHVVGGVEGAYVRTDLCERRRSTMTAWADVVLPG